MSNPTTKVASFNNALDGFSGADPIRYNGGLWLEEATTNYERNPLMWENITGWGNSGKGSGINAALAWNAGAPKSLRWTITSVNTAGGNYMDASRVTAVGSFAPGDPVTVTALVKGVGETGTIGLGIWAADSGATPIGSQVVGTAIAIDGNTHLVTASIPSLPASTSRLLIYVLTRFSANGGAGTVDCLWYQVEKKSYPTSLCPEVDGAGSPNTGYAFTGTAHASSSTRAASSASVTMDEPASVACWYREGYSGPKTFAYLEPYGTLGTYGSIAWSGGTLTLSTSRNLVIGPFAAFSRALTANEQANLRSTQNWSMNSVNGSNIILPLSGRRRPR